MVDVYDTHYLSGLSKEEYENVFRVEWPWAADKIKFTSPDEENIYFRESDSFLFESKQRRFIRIGYPSSLESIPYFCVILFQPSNNFEPTFQQCEIVFFEIISLIVAREPAKDKASILFVEDTQIFSNIVINSVFPVIIDKGNPFAIPFP